MRHSVSLSDTVRRAAAVLGSFALAAAMYAQVDRSALTGTVTDSTGGRVPGAVVTARQEVTGLERKTETSSQGTYALDGLPIGRYTIIFSKFGFWELGVGQMVQT